MLDKYILGESRMSGKQKADLYRVTFGSNTHMDSNGILKVKGKELLKLERGSDDQLLVTTEVRDNKGVLLGKIWRNSFAYVHPDYEDKVEPKGGSLRRIVLTKKSDKTTVFEADIKGRSEIEVNGVFNIGGKTLVATKEYLDTGAIRISNSTFSCNGTDIDIS
jgi:hypothetical protein